MQPSEILSLKNICSLVSASIPHTMAGILWKIVTTLWPWYWLLIGVSLVVWIAFEITTRYGTAHYNSENGFSPTFNRFVGSGTYLGLQTGAYFLLKLIFGDGIYCLSWPYALHLVVFASTGLLLNLIGFWPYLIEPGGRSKRRWKKKRF